MRALPFARLLALLLPAALLAGAFMSQYVFGLPPCEMCLWQRWAHMTAVPLALLSLLVRGARGSFLLVLAALAILASGLVGGFHAGVEYGWWEGITRCTANLGGPDVDMMEAIMDAPLVRCDAAPWTLLGVSLAGYNFLLSCTGAAAIFAMILSARKATA